jgi:hypothetical protein
VTPVQDKTRATTTETSNHVFLRINRLLYARPLLTRATPVGRS